MVKCELADVPQEILQALQEVLGLSRQHVTNHIQGHTDHHWLLPLSVKIKAPRKEKKYPNEQENTKDSIKTRATTAFVRRASVVCCFMCSMNVFLLPVFIMALAIRETPSPAAVKGLAITVWGTV